MADHDPTKNIYQESIWYQKSDFASIMLLNFSKEAF